MNIKRKLKDHTNALLVLFAFLFVVLAAGAFFWGIGYIVAEATTAVNGQPNNAQPPQFDLPDAAKLNYRGTLQQ